MTDQENTTSEIQKPKATRGPAKKPKAKSAEGFDRLTPNRGGDRIGIGSQQNLEGLEKLVDSGMKGYCFLEGRVEAAFQGGYELVRDRDGNHVTRVSVPDKLYLMQIPIEMWEADQKAKHKNAVAAMAESAKIDESKGEYGGTSGRSVEATASDSPLFS